MENSALYTFPDDIPPSIQIRPMLERSELQNMNEDWTGKSSTAERRKLQNLLNQRARRRRQAEKYNLTSSFSSSSPSTKTQYSLFSDSLPSQQFKTPPTTIGTPNTHTSTSTSTLCILPQSRHRITSSENFHSYLRLTTQTRSQTPLPLPVDQALLTLLSFNLIRALTQNVHLLQLNPSEMSLDIPSPFFLPPSPSSSSSSSSSAGGKEALNLSKIPISLHPTNLQKTRPHHPEIDVLPFAKLRDNCIILGLGVEGEGGVDDVEFCRDMLWGVSSSSSSSSPSFSPPSSLTQDQNINSYRDGIEGSESEEGRTGLIVWSDPWLPSSWEIDEAFLRKYHELFVGCEGLIESSNYWRGRRGERPLAFEI